MTTEISKAQDVVSASLVARPGSTERVGAGGVFTVTCHGSDGQFKWSDSFHNLVVNEGLQDMNSKYFKGSGYTAAWFLGLVTGPGSGTTYAAGNTLAVHAGWTENTAYTTTGGAGVRAAVTFGTATTADPSVIANTASPSVFTMTSNAQTIAGAFLASVSTGTSGILFSAGDFTGGDKLVDSGDSLSVTYSFSLDAA
jgi:hypothetical protein